MLSIYLTCFRAIQQAQSQVEVAERDLQVLSSVCAYMNMHMHVSFVLQLCTCACVAHSPTKIFKAWSRDPKISLLCGQTHRECPYWREDPCSIDIFDNVGGGYPRMFREKDFSGQAKAKASQSKPFFAAESRIHNCLKSGTCMPKNFKIQRGWGWSGMSTPLIPPRPCTYVSRSLNTGPLQLKKDSFFAFLPWTETWIKRSHSTPHGSGHAYKN